MPNPYFDVKIISRKAGQSSVASAAYRSGSRLYDERAEKTFNYANRQQILHTEIMPSRQAPAWATDRAQLWNQVEAAETRKDAQLARDVIAALPRELTLEQQIELVQGYVSEHFTDQGMIADIAIHESPASDGGTNPHVHIMLTTREVSTAGFGPKNRSWNSKAQLYAWREGWEAHTNSQLALAERHERVSLQSYRAQGLDKAPQRHLGTNAHAMEKRQGIETEIGDHNRTIKHENALREVLASQRQAAAAVISTEAMERAIPEHNLPAPPGTATAAKHQTALRGYFATTIQRTMQASAELVTRLALAAKTAAQKFGITKPNEASGKTGIFERLARPSRWVDRVDSSQKTSAPEQEHSLSR